MEDQSGIRGGEVKIYLVCSGEQFSALIHGAFSTAEKAAAYRDKITEGEDSSFEVFVQ